MKVLQINVVCGIRSTGRICTDLALALEEKECECKIAYGREFVPEQFKKYAINIGNDKDVKIHGLKARLFGRSGFGSKIATKKLVRWMIEYNPDIIHLHNIHGYYININILFNYLRNSGKPVIWSLYDCWSFTGHCVHFDYIGCNKWKYGCYKCPQKREYPTSLVLDNSKKNYKRKREIFTLIPNMVIVSPSRWLYGLLSNSFLKGYKTEVIPNGIDLDEFKPIKSDLREKYHIGTKKIVLGATSVWNESKGYSYMLRLAEHLGNEYKIVLVGVNKRQMKELLPNILGIMRTNSKEELAQWYTIADVFVNTTLQETQGLTNIEALACGTPVVTFNSGGASESITELCGRVVERGNLNELILAIKKISNEPTSYLPNECRKQSYKYNKKDLVQNYIELYNNVLN